MDFGGRYQRKSSTSDRFLSVFSPPDNSSLIDSAGDELNEEEVFWTGDFAENSSNSSDSRTTSFSDRMFGNRKKIEEEEERFGILAALSDDQLKVQPLRRKASFSPSKSVLPIPRKMQSGESEAVVPKFNFSAPVNVPVLSNEMMKANGRRNKAFFDVVDDDDGEGGDCEMLPPHEIVARGSALTPNTTFSMLEGAGRTLKGRDLRRVRNAVFRQTGFLD